MKLKRWGLSIIIAFAATLVISCGEGADAGEQGDVCSLNLGQGCGDDLFCEFSEFSCGLNGALGLCKKKPAACIQLFAPVCGCDGKSYANSCEAAAEGVSVRSSGNCS